MDMPFYSRNSRTSLPSFNAKNDFSANKTPIIRELSNRPKVMLIIPNLNWVDKDLNALWDLIPWNLCMLAAMIEGFCEVKIVDAYDSNLSQEEFENIIREFSPEVVGITVLMDQYGPAGHMAAELAKNVDPKIVTMMGGVYVTANPDDVIKDESLDYIVIGEGEYVLRDLIKYLQGRSEYELDNGIAYRENGKIINKGHSSLIKDLDALPLPAYHLIDFNKYANKYSERKSIDAPEKYPYARMVTSRGCPYLCSFCQVPSIQGRYFRHRSVENIIAEMVWLKKKYGIQAIIFDDDNLYTNMGKAKQLFAAMIENDLILPWVSIATAVFRLDEEMIDLMCKSGCKYIDVAIESGSKRVTEEIVLKPINHERAKELVTYAKARGIFVSANFIIGFPTETWDEILETIKFAEEINVDYCKIFIAIPLKNTPMYDLAKKQNALTTTGNRKSVWTSGGLIQTTQFKASDLTILRAYEWDRINFTDPKKRKKITDRMKISESDLQIIRRRTLDNACKKVESNLDAPEKLDSFSPNISSKPSDSYPNLSAETESPVPNISIVKS